MKRRQEPKQPKKLPICTRCGHEACWPCLWSGAGSCDRIVEGSDFEICCDGECVYSGDDAKMVTRYKEADDEDDQRQSPPPVAPGAKD